MPTFRITFIDGSQREVQAFKIDGNKPSDRGDSYSFMIGNRAAAVVPKAQVKIIEKIDDGDTQ